MPVSKRWEQEFIKHAAVACSRGGCNQRFLVYSIPLDRVFTKQFVSARAGTFDVIRYYFPPGGLQLGLRAARDPLYDVLPVRPDADLDLRAVQAPLLLFGHDGFTAFRNLRLEFAAMPCYNA